MSFSVTIKKETKNILKQEINEGSVKFNLKMLTRDIKEDIERRVILSDKRHSAATSPAKVMQSQLHDSVSKTESKSKRTQKSK